MSSSSGAADTGTCVGRIIELWHRGGEDAIALEEAVQRAGAESATTCPQADLDQATSWAVKYAADIRNQGGVVIAEMQEGAVQTTLDLRPDYDGEVVIKGHPDQIRRGVAGLEVWDVKSGDKRWYGGEMTRIYAWQLAAYAVACTDTWGEEVRPGGIIRLRDYDGRGAVLHPVSWTLQTARGMLAEAAYRIAELQRGIVCMTPGFWCSWCPAGDPGMCAAQIDVVLG